MVVMLWPATEPTWVMQERTARPSIRTVHAPQTPMPQPYLAPLRSSTSRSTHKSGVSGGTSTVFATLFTFNLRGIGSLLQSGGEALWERIQAGRNCSPELAVRGRGVRGMSPKPLD